MPTTTSLPTEKTQTGVALKDYISLFYGQPGVGKTTFVNNFGNVFFLSTDRGTRFMKAMARNCLTWDQFDKVLRQLEKPDAPNYDFVCVDHIGDWAAQGETWTLKKLGADALADPGYGKGWSEYRKTLTRFLHRLVRLDAGLIFIAHETTKTVKIQGLEVDRCMPQMNKQTWELVIPLCDIIGYCGIRAVKRGGKRTEIRTLETEPRRDLYVKDRTARTPNHPSSMGEWENLGGPEFIQTFKGVRTDGKTRKKSSTARRAARGRRARH